MHRRFTRVEALEEFVNVRRAVGVSEVRLVSSVVLLNHLVSFGYILSQKCVRRYTIDQKIHSKDY